MTAEAGPVGRVGTGPIPHIEALTGLRFIAAATVLVEHFHQVVPGVSSSRLAQGGAGVSLFFVLSGFVLTLNYGERFAERGADVRSYLVKRVARIVPLHLFALAITAILVFVRNNPIPKEGLVPTIASLAANVVLIQAWIPAKVLDLWNGPAWSISAELFFYLMFPLVIPFIVWPAMRRRRLGTAIIVVLVAEVLAFIALSWLAGTILLNRGDDPESARFVVTRLALFPPIRIGEFLAGCLLAAVFGQRAKGVDHSLDRLLGSAINRTRVLAAAAVAFLAIQWSPQYLDGSIGSTATTVWSMIDLRIFASYLPISVLVVAAIAWGDSPVARALRSPRMVRLGEASYALYIIQWIGWRIINDRAIGPPGVLIAAAAIAGCLVASLLVHDLIEKPARRWVLGRYLPSSGAGPSGSGPTG